MTSPSSELQPIDAPCISVPEIQRLAAAQLSRPSRLGHVLLLLMSLMVAAVVGSLWVTEPSLPPRTHLAFGLILSGALAWTTFAAWVLARRRVLFGAERVLAAKMGIAFSAIGAVGLAAIGYGGGAGSGAYLGAAMHAGLCGAAAALLVRARRRVTVLSRRRQELDSQMTSRLEHGTKS